MQCYTELIQPSAVTHAISLSFCSSSSTNLIVAKTSLLQVFSVKSVQRTSSHQQDSNEEQSLEGEGGFAKLETKARLVLVGEYSLSGTVTSLARIKSADTRSGGEALLVSFKDAKVSLIEWDPENYRISTISIHYYEGDKVQSAPFGPALGECDSKLTVDPRSRCAALRFGVRHLAIIPFRQAGDDIAEAEDFDQDEPRPAKTERKEDAQVDGIGISKPTPYAASFVLPLTALDPGLTHPVDVAFLYEYREPTFGIISANKAASQALLEERKDILSYTVYTLDLEQRASTTLLSVTGLPYDISRVIPLPPPIGGALLVGANELIHVDQSGKTNSIAVNEFAKLASNFSLSDESHLGLRLEDCAIQPLGNASSDLLIVLDTGALAILSIRSDGRNVSGLSIHKVDDTQGSNYAASMPTSSADLGKGRLFIGSDMADSIVLGFSQKTQQISLKRSHSQMVSEDLGVELDEEDLEDDDDADDDLYGGEPVKVKKTASHTNKPSSPSDYIFRLHDTLPCLGPINSVCLGKPALIGPTKRSTTRDPPVSLFASVGRGAASTLAAIQHEIVPDVVYSSEVPATRSLWGVKVKRPAAPGIPEATTGQQDGQVGSESNTQLDDYLIAYDFNGEAEDASKIYKIKQDSTTTSEDPWTQVEGTEFESEGETTNVGVLSSGTRIIQVRSSEIRTYDTDLGLSQILPIIDEETDEELTIVHSCICDPYVLVIRNNSTIQILQMDKSGDLEEIEAGDELTSLKWISGCIYLSEHSGGQALACLLSEKGGLHIFSLPDLKHAVYVASALSDLPPVLSIEEKQRRGGARETLTEVLLADLGDQSCSSPYLILRSSMDDVTLYEPFRFPMTANKPLLSVDGLRFRKVPGLHIPRYNEEGETQSTEPMRVLPNVSGYKTVAMAGASPCMILRSAASHPRIVGLRSKSIRTLTALSTPVCSNGLATIDQDGDLRLCQLPDQTYYTNGGWSIRKLSVLPPEHQIHQISYHSERNVYILISSEETDFYLPEDDYKPHELDENITLRPRAQQFHIHLLSPSTNAIISSYPFQTYEAVTSLSVSPLEMSENTHAHRLLVAAGTITQRGEAYAAKGCLYVWDIVTVVPEPGHPETGHKLRLVSREETRGAVTALAGIGGVLATGQGAKMIFRGLREDGQNLPIGFLDAQTYMSSIKSLGGSKLWLAADAFKGVWFGGFAEEPYKITLFGKSRAKMEVVGAEFLPFAGALYVLVVDAHVDLHILQYEPENPKSLAGQRLVHRSTFHTGHLPRAMMLVPSTLKAFEEQADEVDGDGEVEAEADMLDGGDADKPDARMMHVLVANASGSVGLVTPLDETTYRRLSALQGSLSSILEHACGLNPRAYRNVETEEGLGGARGVVDGDLICRIGELGAPRRNEVLARAGSEPWMLRSDLEILAGGGLGYL